MSVRGERCEVCRRPTYAGEDFGGPCPAESDAECASSELAWAAVVLDRMDRARVLYHAGDDALNLRKLLLRIERAARRVSRWGA